VDRQRIEAIVLKRSPLGESDWLVTLLSAAKGLLRGVASGARRSKKRFGGCLELFAEIDIEIVDKGPSKLARFVEAVLINPHDPIKSDLIAIAHAGYLAELVLVLVQEREEAITIYQLFKDQLQALDQGPLDVQSLRRFELEMLSIAGLAPHLDNCIECGTDNSPEWLFDYDQGGVVCRHCQRGACVEVLSSPTLEYLQQLQCINDSVEQEESTDAGVVAAARQLLARIIDRHVGRPLKAREFLRQIAKKE
jgi:DNA repair protein RecO (recombination protein O)